MHKTALKYMYLIKNGMFTENELIFFRKYVNNNNTDSDEILTCFVHKAKTIGIRLTQEQQQKGLEFLHKRTFKLNGELRKNALLTVELSEMILPINFDKFICVGLHNLNEFRRQYVPVYRCIAKDGRSFDYICKMWGEIEIVNTTYSQTYYDVIDLDSRRKRA